MTHVKSYFHKLDVYIHLVETYYCLV